MVVNGWGWSLLVLAGSSDVTGAVLLFLALTAGGLDGLGQAGTDQTVVGLKGTQSLLIVVDEGKAPGASATKGNTVSEQDDRVDVADSVLLGKDLAQLGLGDRGTARVDDINNHLAPAEEGVRDELGGTDSASRHCYVVC